MSSRILVADYDAGAGIPSLELSSTEAQIAAITSLRGWWEADANYTIDLGGRWFDKRFGVGAFTYSKIPAVKETVSSVTRLRMGYSAGVAFDGTDRGAMLTSTDHPLLSTLGFTVISVQRVGLPAENATVGGYVWSSMGTPGNDLPGLNISGSTGDPIFRAGGVSMVNPSALDLRDGNMHIVRCTFDGATDTISVNTDRDYISATATGATTNLISTMLTPAIGATISLNDPRVLSSPFNGQLAAILFFNAPLTGGNLTTVENYLAAKYGVTLV